MSEKGLIHRIDWGGSQGSLPSHSTVFVEGGILRDYSPHTYYNTFVDILNDENFIGDNLELLIKTTDKRSIEMQVSHMLGCFAEALVVKRCNENEEINRYFANTARNGCLTHPYPKKFTAVGTGTNYTSNHPILNMHYKPSDCQFDIIWVKNSDVRKLLRHPTPDIEIDAGLQLKTGLNWQSFRSTISQYWHPVVYFDLANDWTELDNYIKYRQMQNQLDPLSRWHRVQLVPHNEITHQIKQELLWFRSQLLHLYYGKFTVKYIIDMAKAEQRFHVMHAITGNKGHIQRLITEKTFQECQQEDIYAGLNSVAARFSRLADQIFNQ